MSAISFREIAQTIITDVRECIKKWKKNRGTNMLAPEKN